MTETTKVPVTETENMITLEDFPCTGPYRVIPRLVDGAIGERGRINGE
jgi:hypothetical protein